MFPTVIRNQAVGTCSLVARIGGILCLLLDLLKVYWLPAPVFIMGVVATTAGILATTFPETLGEELPETMEDAFRYDEWSEEIKHFLITRYSGLERTRREVCAASPASISRIITGKL